MFKFNCTFFALFLLALSNNSHGDNPLWVKAIHGASIASIERTLGGGYVTAGSKYNNGSPRALLIKLNSFGDIQWAKKYGDNHNSGVSTLLQTADGGFVFAGYTTSHQRDALIIKVDVSGNIIWQKFYQSASKALDAKVILQAADGGFFVLGNLYDKPTSNIWCMKLDSNGSILWIRIYGYTRNRGALATAIGTNDGGLLFVGKKYQQGDDYETLYVKLDSHGKIIWQKKSTGGQDFYAQPTIAQTADGGYVIGGGLISYGPVNWIIKLDSKGNPSWERTFEAPNVRAVRQESDGHILVMGDLGYGRDAQIWSGRFDLQGALLSQATYGERSIGDDVFAIHDTAGDGTVFVGSRFTEEGTSTESVLGRTSSSGNVCNAFQESKTITVYIPGTIEPFVTSHIRIRKGTFNVKAANLSATDVSPNVTNLCK